MTISRASFELVESMFGLSPATIPSFFHHSGVFSKHITKETQDDPNHRVSIVMKAHQKVEVANYLLSLTHDFKSGWTTGFLCGDGAIGHREPHRQYGLQLQQIVDLITSTVHLWNDPILLPAILLQNYSQRTEARTLTLQAELKYSESLLGVTSAGGVKPIRTKKWPADVDIKQITTDLHTTMTQTVFICGVCEWARQYGKFVLDQEDEIHGNSSPKSGQARSTELRDSILHVTSSLEGVYIRCNTFRERAQTQINVVSELQASREKIFET
jgi:hypothetical protein